MRGHFHKALMAAVILLGLSGTGRAGPIQDGAFVTSDGVRLHILQAAPASGRRSRCCVFVPGWTMPAWIFAPQIAFFSRRWPVVALDPRGQGDSDIPRGAMSRGGGGGISASCWRGSRRGRWC